MSESSKSSPPVAAKRPHRTGRPGHERDDPYFWLRERDNPEVRAYLEAENAYTEAQTAGTKAFEAALYEEMLGRIKEDDESVPVREGPFLYYSRTIKGKNYRLLCRRPLPEAAPESEAGPEHVYLDQNALAEGQAYFSLGDVELSPDHRLCAYTVDTAGDERYLLRIRDLSTGEELEDRVEDIGGGVVIAEDGEHLLYTRLDDAHRPFEVWRHRIGTPATQDVRIFHEPDEKFFVGLGRTRSRRFITIDCDSKITSEVRLLPGADPTAELRVVAPRQSGVEYAVEHHEDRLLIVTNRDAVNFRVVQAPIDEPGPEHWVDVVPHVPDIKIDDIDAFETHLVVSRRREGVPELVVMDVASGTEHIIEQAEPVYAAWVSSNPNYRTRTLRFGYSSMITPTTTYDYDIATRQRVERKRQPVIGYDPSGLVSERIFATASDGTKVPISLVRKADAPKPGPLFMSGYGSYGHSYDATFSSVRLSMVERGVTVAIAHIRGGGEMGRPWYEDGKLLHKKNTFTDFIACAQTLVEQGYTTSEQLAVYGGSAGGLLMGAVANLRPDLFNVVVADVPFVDVLNTMLDPTIPLTVIEYEEWGNPAEEPYGEYIESYSPYDNIAAAEYPNMLVLAGWSDPRVQYWEPAKYVAKLRTVKQGDATLLLKTNLDAGHAGASGRYDALKEIAFEYAFVLQHLKIES